MEIVGYITEASAEEVEEGRPFVTMRSVMGTEVEFTLDRDAARNLMDDLAKIVNHRAKPPKNG
jgi:hypothetical protein